MSSATEHIILSNNDSEYKLPERALLLQTARDSIKFYLEHKKLLTVSLNNYPEQLQHHRACFVTLHLNNQLRGCIGSLTAYQPLILDVIQNAYSAAFRDPRFPPVSTQECPQLKLDISILTPAKPMHFSSEADLLHQLRPGVDGLILADHGHRGTFLPSVWEQLPDPVDFLRHLKNKAGLPADYWSATLTIENYTAELIS